MKEERLRRYKEKLEKMEQRVGEIREWINSARRSERDKLATYKAFQEVSEASMDVVAMMVKDMKMIPEDDYINIEKLAGKGIIDEKLKEVLEEANGLRNRIVHEYNGLDQELALNSIEDILSGIDGFLTAVNSWLRKQL
jgi:uncharacterized protein YutE (UPF0331/DUF86 family)